MVKMARTAVIIAVYIIASVILVIIVASIAKFTRSEVCCPEVGCFQTDGSYSHLPPPQCVENFGMEFQFHTRHNASQRQTLSRTSSIPIGFANDRRTVFIIHGYTDSIEKSYMTDIKDAILEKDDANVFLVAWENGADEVYYPKSASNTRTVGAEVALMMDRLVTEAGLPTNNLWCIGFSLGAHACGFAGYRTKIQHVTGLDPAGPCFDRIRDPKLTPSAATLVDVIHTDGGLWGQLSRMGHMDFYPNGGVGQPGCLTYAHQDTNSTDNIVESYGGSDLESYPFRDKNSTNNIVESYDGSDPLDCSHMRAVLYFVQSIKKGCFKARNICADEKTLPSSCKPCSGGLCGEMGYYADQYNTRGMFYLQTADRSGDFCRY